MRLIALTGSVALACLLSACGGGGSGGSGPINSTPTPTPAPTPTPTPTPAQTNSSLSNLQFTESFEGRGAINPVTLSKGTGNVTGQSSMTNRQIQVRYDAASHSYTVQSGDYPDATFGPANRTAASSNATITVYDKANGSVSEELVLFNPGSSNPQMALTYTSYGAWQVISDNGTSLGLRTIFFIFGVKTLPTDLPKSGTANYQTHLDGQFAGSTGVYSLSGSSSFSADFGAGTVAFSMTPQGQHILNGSLKTFGTLSGTGTINSATSGFDASSGTRAAGQYGVGLLGTFFGPAATEFGASFYMLGPDGQGNGALVGKK